MYARLSYITSGMLHALLLGLLATVESTLLIEFQVRSGRATPIVSRAARAQAVTLESRIWEETSEPTHEPVMLTMPVASPPMPAALDDRQTASTPATVRERRLLNKELRQEPSPLERETAAVSPVVSPVNSATAPELVVLEPAPESIPLPATVAPSSIVRAAAATEAPPPLEQTPLEQTPLAETPPPVAMTPVPQRSRSRRPVRSQQDLAQTEPARETLAPSGNRPDPSELAMAITEFSPRRETPESLPEPVRPTTTPPPRPEVTVAEVTDPTESPANSVAANETQGAKVDQLPRPLPRNVEPVYPEELRRRQVGGKVLLQVSIDAEGRVSSVTVARSSGEPALDAAAVSAVRSWRFAPARRGLLAVPFAVHLPISFSIRNP